MFIDFLDIILYFMLINFKAHEFFFVKNRRYFSDFVAVLKISLLWRTLLLQRKWVPHKRGYKGRYKAYRNIYARDANNTLRTHNIEPNSDEKERMSRNKL